MIFFYEKRLIHVELTALRKDSFSKGENTKSILLPGAGFAPWTPNGALPLYPAGGLSGSQTPGLWGVSDTQCHLLSLYLHLL